MGRTLGRAHRRPRGANALAAGLVLALPASLVALLAWSRPLTAWVPAPAEPAGPRRRDALVLAGLAGAVPAWSTALPARAEIAWQLKLPRSWTVFSTTDQPPPGEKKPVALVVAGNADQGGELTVLRVPIDTSDASPDKAGSLALVKYFSTPAGKSPPVSAGQVVEALTRSQRTASMQTKFEMVGSPVETVRSGRRYIRYDFEQAICQGSVEKGIKGDRCVDDANNEFPPLERTHAITFTVDQAEGDILWLVDISAPTVGWPKFKPDIDALSESFEVGNPDALEQDRTAVIEAMTKALNAQVEAARQAQEAAKASA